MVSFRLILISLVSAGEWSPNPPLEPMMHYAF